MSDKKVVDRERPPSLSRLESEIDALYRLTNIGLTGYLGDSVLSALFEEIYSTTGCINDAQKELQSYTDWVEQQWDEASIALAEVLLEKKEREQSEQSLDRTEVNIEHAREEFKNVYGVLPGTWLASFDAGIIRQNAESLAIAYHARLLRQK